ncbi:MAG: hypothetical protein SCM11_04800 [Bacillota bacterium]|nr:hypothetical protein [Bacillota bacterium]
MTVQLMVGAARAVISPPVGTLLMGYAPARPAKAIHDDLTVSVLALAYGNKQALLASATIGIFDNKRVQDIRHAIAGQTGIPWQNIILCATHTHSGPETSAVHGWSDLNTGYYESILEPRLMEAVREAVDTMEAVKTGIGTSQSDVGVNRRSIDRNGKVNLGQCPWGYYDPTMTVISFRSPKRVVANIIHYCAHATAAGRNDEITRDWPGPMVDRLDTVTGGVTCFLNGAIGDTGPRLPNGATTGDLAMAMELGAKAGIDAAGAYHKIKEWRSLDLGMISREICFPYAPLPPLSEAKAAIQQFADPESLFGMPRANYVRWRNIIAEYESGRDLETHFHYDQTLMRIGPVVFVPFAHEMFVEMTLRLRHYSPYPHTLCLSNANGAYAYFPTQDQICRGGYEIEAEKLLNTYILAPDADEAAVSENLTLIEDLKLQQEQ